MTRLKPYELIVLQTWSIVVIYMLKENKLGKNGRCVSSLLYKYPSTLSPCAATKNESKNLTKWSSWTDSQVKICIILVSVESIDKISRLTRNDEIPINTKEIRLFAQFLGSLRLRKPNGRWGETFLSRKKI